MKFEAVGNGGTVECYCIIKSVEKKTSTKGGAYLDLTIADKSGEMNAKLWDYSEMLHGVFAAGDLVKLRGTVSRYNGTEQLKIDKIRPVNNSDNVSIEQFVPSADLSGEQMWETLYGIAERFADKDLSAIVTSILEERKEPLLYWPAAFKMHHAIRGGLLFHTLSIVRLAESICNVYTFADRDLLLAGAILHDIGKIDEFLVSDVGLVTGYSVEGNLLGHITKGAMLINEHAANLGIESNVPMLLSHMLLSHHGVPEFGAVVLPQFLEAELLSQLDLMDATTYEITEAVSAVEVGEFTGRMNYLNGRRLYNHGRTKGAPIPKLI